MLRTQFLLKEGGSRDAAICAERIETLARSSVLLGRRDPPNSLGQLLVHQDIYSQSYFYYSNLPASVNVPPNGGPLDPNTKISGYPLLNARVEWADIAGSKVHAAAYVRSMLNRQLRSEVLDSAQPSAWIP
jgi:hypothetical protein